MRKCFVAILVFGLFESILCYSVARIKDPLTIALEQILSDLTFEIVPYPTYPDIYPVCQSQPYPINNYFTLDGICQCYKDLPEYCDFYESLGCKVLPYPNFFEYPCGMDDSPACSCYRDIREPCNVYDDPASSCICFDCLDSAGPPPYIYFPQVEYPMSAMDIRPYYYGNCWCS